MATILITGGTGFIGSRLAVMCRQSGDIVRVLGQSNTPAEEQNIAELQARGIDFVRGSVLDPATIERALEGVETVYHLAAAQHEAGKPDQHFHDVNVLGTKNMLEASTAAGVRRFVHGSTIGVYKSDEGVVRETSPTVPDNIYGITKLAAEKELAKFVDRLPIVVIRISETYGPGDRRLLKLYRQVQNRRYVHIGPSKNLHHPVYIDDLVAALRLAATKEDAVGRTLVVPGYEVVTSREMVDTIARILDVPPPSITIPLWPVWTAATLMEWTMRPLGINPPLHRRRMHFFIKSFDFSGDRAEQLLGYQPQIDFEEGSRRTATWYRQNGLLD